MCACQLTRHLFTGWQAAPSIFLTAMRNFDQSGFGIGNSSDVRVRSGSIQTFVKKRFRNFHENICGADQRWARTWPFHFRIAHSGRAHWNFRIPDAIFFQILPDSGFWKLRVPDLKKIFLIENQNNQTMEMGSQILFQFQSLSLSAPQLNMLVCLLIFQTFSAHVPRPRHCHSFGGRAAESSFKKHGVRN